MVRYYYPFIVCFHLHEILPLTANVSVIIIKDIFPIKRFVVLIVFSPSL